MTKRVRVHDGIIGVPLALLIPGGLMWGAHRTTVQDNFGHRF